MNRRQNIFSLILVTAMLWNVFYVPLTYAYYYIDQSDFIAQFCENTDKPELKCNGKCHLQEVSKKDATNDKAPSVLFLILALPAIKKYPLINILICTHI